MPPPDLIDVAEIVRMLGRPRRSVYRWIAREELGFPAPYIVAGGKRLWRRRAVDEWARRTLPLPRGPRPS